MSDIPELLDYSNLYFAESQQQTNSLLDDPNLASAIKKMVEVQLPAMMFPIVKRFLDSFLGTLEPMMENLVRNIVKEQIELVQERFFTTEKWKSQDETHTSHPLSLELQFLDKVSRTVYTGKQIKGERGNNLQLALVDSEGNPVNSGPEASAKVEIVVLQEGADDGDNCVESNAMIGEKKERKPILSKTCLKLKEGIADLDDFKFKNNRLWTKRSEVKLVARVVENLNGTIVKDATTESFLVMDCRIPLYKKHYPPLLSDDVWRLEKIRRGGQLHKRLQRANINTVEELLRSLNLDAQSLQERLDVSAAKFKAIVDHAQTCMIGSNLHKYYSPNCERKAAVVFDVVGRLQGLLHGDQFVSVDNLAEDEKVDAHKMVVSAFEHRKDVQPIDIVASIADFPSQSPNGVNTSSSPRVESPSGSDYGMCKAIDGIDNALSRASSRHLSPIYSLGRMSSFDGFGSLPMDNMEFLSQGIHYSDLSTTACADPGDNEHLQFLIFDHNDNLQCANPSLEAQADQSTAATGGQRAVAHVPSSSQARSRWRMAVVSLRKRIIAPEDSHAQKKQRHS
ncbi:hypothetical protein ACH5RR_025643 [Cinchona calisaya]|uniref:Uncharacterized protein n=1 Tax=Cinchona calisaya TaxID=153742 RepID=A0ABD2Z0Q5_9GENT